MAKKKTKEYINDNLDNTVWLGEVVDINDPDKEQKIKVRVFGKFDTLELESIPWAICDMNAYFGSSTGTVSHNLPQLGNIVQVSFDNGNIYAPKWKSLSYVSDELKQFLTSLEENDYANATIILYDTINSIFIYNIPSQGFYIKTLDVDSGNVISIDKDSIIKIRNSNGNEIIVNEDNILMKSKDDTAIHIKKDGISLGSIDKSEYSSMLYEEWEKLWNDVILPQIGNISGIPTPAGPSGALKTATNWSIITDLIKKSLKKVKNPFITLRK